MIFLFSYYLYLLSYVLFKRKVLIKKSNLQGENQINKYVMNEYPQRICWTALWKGVAENR